jgi:hypothetical protein
MLNEIENLYRVVDEVFSECERLREKRANGKASNEDLIRLSVFEHLTNTYFG